MNIYEVAKIFSSENKSKIITHFYSCDCNCDEKKSNKCVSQLEEILQINQSNLSKHIGKLTGLGVLVYSQVHKERFYRLNSKFIKEHKDLIEQFINARENKSYSCKSC